VFPQFAVPNEVLYPGPPTLAPDTFRVPSNSRFHPILVLILLIHASAPVLA